MALVVGNLLTDPEATSFISLADALAYLTAEGADAGENTPLGKWFASGTPDQEATLVRASRWLAVSLSWCDTALSDDDLVRVGHVAARLAVQALTVDLWASEGAKDAKRYKAGSVEVEYQDGRSSGAKAGGKKFPWVYPMLRGLLCGGGAQHDVVRR